LTFEYRTRATEILHNGHTIQVPVPSGDTVTLQGRKYELKQFHFHAPSEHHIAGRPYPLEVHLVHADSSGALLVVGVLFEEGSASPALGHLWTHMPPVAGESHPLVAPLLPGLLLPKQQDSYRFAGSLTTPPCTEGVQWVVLREPLTASAGQLELVAGALGEANNRPVQPLHDRVVYR
jgi:carbonic anhydrase